MHADFVSGSRELAADGARLLAPAGSGLSFPHEELRDGEDLDLGGLTLRALATPGHTPEHLSYLLLDGTAPVAVFTGGALIVGRVARTDFAQPAQAEEWTWVAYRSARELLALPGDLAAYALTLLSGCWRPGGSPAATAASSSAMLAGEPRRTDRASPQPSPNGLGRLRALVT